MKRVLLATLLLLGVTARAGLAQPTPLGGEFRVNTTTTFYQYPGGVAALAGGGFVVVWRNDGASSTDLVARRYASSGAPSGGEFAVNTYTTSFQNSSDVAATGTGFVVVWVSFGQDGDQSGIFGRLFDSAGAGGGEFRVNTTTTGSQDRPVVASLPASGFVVAWGSSDGNSPGIFAQRYASDGATLGGEFRVNASTTGNQTQPAVAVDSSGAFTVVWNDYDASSLSIAAQRFTSAGSPLGGPFRVNSYTTSVQAGPSVAYTGGGAFVVTWASANQDGMQGGIFGQRYDSTGAPTGGEFRVNSYTTNAQYIGHVAASAGDFMVVWDSNYQNNARPAGTAAARPSPLGLGLGHGVIGQLFASSGPPLGSDFRVNSYTSRGQSYMRIGADSSGTFLVVWASDGQDGSNFGVYGQRYCTSLLTGVAINVNGSTSLSCPNGTGGIATVTDTGGGTSSHQWGYRTTSGGTVMDIAGQTSPMYLLSGSDFPGPGPYLLVETTTPTCGSATVSNEIAVSVTDAAAPIVTAPVASTITQTLCQ